MTQTVSLGLNKGKLVVDLEVGWVSLIVHWIAFMKDWKACSDLEKGMVRESFQLLVSELGKQWRRPSKHNLIGDESLPMGVAVSPRPKTK